MTLDTKVGMDVMNSCNMEPTDKKAFGIAVYARLRETYGVKDHYDVAEIEQAVRAEGYPETWECWALVAFMLPANAGEYFRSRETPVDVLGMKRAFIREMTNGESERLQIRDHTIPDSDLTPPPLTKMNLVNLFAFNEGYSIGTGFLG